MIREWKGLLYFFLALFSGSLIFLGFGVVRSQFWLLITLYAVAFLSYAVILSLVKHNGIFRLPLFMAIGVRVVLLFSTPNLSDDFYRYMWDGQLLKEGVNPYAMKPSEVVTANEVTYSREVYNQLNSQDFYTVYPPTSQAVFFLSAYFSGGSFSLQVFFLKLFVLLFEIGSIFLILQLLRHFGLEQRWVLLYALNPLVISELMNIHYEGGMVFFTLAAVYLLVRNRWVFSSLFMGLAICTKLWPLFFIPFVFRRLGIVKGMLFSGLTLVCTGVCFYPFYFPGLFENIGESLQLYVEYFAFNAPVYYLFLWIGDAIAGMDWYFALQRALPLTFVAIAFLVFVLDKARNWQSVFVKCLFVLTTYLFLATTIHPWYIVPLIAFSVFTRYRYAIVWSAFITLTYITYQTINYAENYWLITIEYLVVFGVFLYEVVLFNTRFVQSVQRWQLLRKAKIKWLRLKPHLNPGTKILDVGTGNGALCKWIQNQGFEVTTIDVKDKNQFPGVNPEIYNGKDFPFRDQSFDTVIIITVLHHTEDPDQLISEAERVGKRVIIMEDIYQNTFQKYLTFLVDSIVNNEFWIHPHSNRTDEGWKKAFNRAGMRLTNVVYHPFLLFFRQVTYVLEKK